MNSIKKDKDELREKYLAARAAMDPSVKEERDSRICTAAVGLVSFRYAEYVLMYAPLDNEIDVMPIAEAAWKSGKKVAFPRCDKATHTMKYHMVSSCDELTRDSYGIREPSPAAPVYDPEWAGSAVCFVPGLLYDKAGYRLGYGKGFYDRYLSEFKGSRIGVVYSDYIMPTVPRGRFDVSVDILLTENGVKTVKK
ncbi:MAG: 5-formyltetrahydrofolate cyclo-ligase [Clostridia bacterium]|nr:5-formyltetrahydrofolate cyclo-ligase [Clostridia bacterium]